MLPSTPPAWFDEGAALIRQANPAMSCAIAPGATSVVDSDCNLKGTSFRGLEYGGCGTTNDVTPQGLVTIYHCVFSYALPDPPDPWFTCSGGAGPWASEVTFGIPSDPVPYATLGQCLQAIRAGSPVDDSNPDPQAQKRNPATPASRFAVDGPQTTLTSMTVANVMPGATVALRCLGTKCPFETKRTTKARNRVVNALAMLGKKPAKRRFRAGQSLELRITAPGYLGKVIRYKIRKGKQPKVTKLCLPRGGRRPDYYPDARDVSLRWLRVVPSPRRASKCRSATCRAAR